MSGVAICTDSSALFPAGVAARLGITVVPIQITLNGDPYHVREDEIDDFYGQLAAGARATTSQPSPGEFLDAYTSAAAGGATEVLSLHLDGRVSGTVAAAELAARDAPIPVTVVDTRTVSFGVGVCVRAAADAVAAGAPARGAVETARTVGSRLQSVFVAAGAPAGRVLDASGWAVLEFVDGETRPVAPCGSVEEAVEVMAARVEDPNGSVRAAVGHAAADTEPGADALATSLASSSRVVDVERYRVGPAVGAHTGPLSFGVFWWPTDEPRRPRPGSAARRSVFHF